MKRILTWFVPATAVGGPQTKYGPVYRLDTDYRPSSAWVVAKSPARQEILIDLLVDGVSFMDTFAIAAPQTEGDGSFKLGDNTWAKGSEISMDITQGGSVGDLTIELELREA